MQRSLTKGPITGSILLFALPLMLAYLLSATPLGVTGIWLSVPIGWALADAIGIGYYLKTTRLRIWRITCKRSS